MPPPRKLEPLPEIADLPSPLRTMAQFIVTCPQSSPDYLFLMADALDEAGNEDEQPAIAAACIRLADELRRRAPEYA